MNQPHYRPEDQFKAASNAMRLRELHRIGDINGLLDFALILNHEAAFNYSRMIYCMSEALRYAGPVTEHHEDLARQTEKMLNEHQEKMAAEFTERLNDH